MGKASRAKRERKEQDAAATAADTRPVTGGHGRERRQLPIFWIVVGLFVLGGIITLFATAPSDDEKGRVDAVADAPSNGEVTISGDQLPAWTGDAADDPAVGDVAPRVTGIDVDEAALTVPDSMRPTAIVVVAHWCPHCQDEVPRIVDWAKDDGKPDGVDVVAVSTQASPDQSNFPPAAWLAREEWPFPVLLDDEVGSAADAFGTDGFPFLVFVGADGKVVSRYSGEMPIDEFDAAVQEIAKTGTASGADAGADAKDAAGSDT